MKGQKMTAEREAEYVKVLRDPQYTSERQRCMALGVTPSGGTQRKLQELRNKYGIPEPEPWKKGPQKGSHIATEPEVLKFSDIRKEDRLIRDHKRLAIIAVTENDLTYRDMQERVFTITRGYFEKHAREFTKVTPGDPKGNPVTAYIDPAVKKPAVDNPDFDTAVQDMVKGTKFEQVMARAKAEKSSRDDTRYMPTVESLFVGPPKAAPPSIDIEMDPIRDDQMDPAYLFDRMPDMEREISETVIGRRDYLDRIERLLDLMAPLDDDGLRERTKLLCERILFMGIDGEAAGDRL